MTFYNKDYISSYKGSINQTIYSDLPPYKQGKIDFYLVTDSKDFYSGIEAFVQFNDRLFKSRYIYLNNQKISHNNIISIFEYLDSDQLIVNINQDLHLSIHVTPHVLQSIQKAHLVAKACLQSNIGIEAILFEQGRFYYGFQSLQVQALLDPCVHKSIRNPLLDTLTLEIPSEAEMVQQLVKDFPTHEQFMQDALYDPRIGYYSTGKIRLGNVDGHDFVTFPITCSPHFGRAIAQHGFDIWEKMLKSGDMQKGAEFTFLEMGAGTGQQAYDTLAFIHAQASQDPKWKEFQQCLRYRIGEISEALKQVQKEKCGIFGNQLEFINAHALDMSKIPSKQFSGLFVSNELPDAFPVHKAVITESTIEIVVILPSLTQAGIDYCQTKGLSLEAYISKSQALKEKYGDLLRYADNTIFLSRKDLIDFVHSCQEEFLVSNDEGMRLQDKIQFVETTYPINFFPEALKYLTQNEESIRRLTPGDTFPINLGLEKLYSGISRIMKRGFVFTIDYGDNDYEWSQSSSLRSVRYYPVGSNLYDQFSFCDITSTIPFTTVERIGRRYGLERCFYGHQEALEHSKPMAELSVADEFHILIQKVEGTAASYDLPSIQSPLTDKELLHIQALKENQLEQSEIVLKTHPPTLLRHIYSIVALKTIKQHAIKRLSHNLYQALTNGQSIHELLKISRDPGIRYLLQNNPSAQKQWGLAVEFISNHFADIREIAARYRDYKSFDFKSLATLFRENSTHPDTVDIMSMLIIKNILRLYYREMFIIS